MKKRVLSMLIALAMVLTVLPMAALAESTATSSSSGVAMPYADDNGVITLTEDVTLSAAYTVDSGETVIIDLNGYNITTTAGCALVNKGTLTVRGSGTVRTSAGSSAAVANFPGGVVNLNGGTYISDNWYVIKNMGTMVIDGTVTVKKPEGSTNTASLIDNGWVGGTDAVAGEKVTARADSAKLTIKNGAFTGESGQSSCSVVKNDDYGVLEITGGEFDSTNNTGSHDATTVLNWNIATISGGTFKGSYTITNGAYTGEADKGQLTISGGTFTGTSEIIGYNNGGNAVGKLTINDGYFTAPAFGNTNGAYTVEVAGGYFSVDPSDYCVEGKTGVSSGNSKYPYTVGDKTVDVETEVAVAAPSVSVPEGISGVTEETIEKAVNNSDTNSDLATAATDIANDATVIPTESEATAVLENAGIDVTEKEITVVVEPYLDVKVESYDSSEHVLKMEIEAYYNVVATTAENVNDMVDGRNAVTVSTGHKLNVTEPVSITVPLPDEFTTEQSLWVKHTKDSGKVYYHEGTVDGSTLTFINDKGFSGFEMGGKVEPAARIGTTAYATLQEAVDEVNDGERIVILKDGETATVNRTVEFYVEVTRYHYEINIGANCTNNGTDRHYDVTYNRPAHTGGGTTNYQVIHTYVDGVGTIEPSGDVMVRDGEDKTLTFTPGTGYEIGDVVVNHKSVGAVSSYTVKDIDGTVNVEVTFVKSGSAVVSTGNTANNPTTGAGI